MTQKLFLIFILVGMGLVFRSPETFALQSGGVVFGELEAGVVNGHRFAENQVDVTLTAQCIGGHKAWVPSRTTMDLSVNRPILIKITNLLPISQGIRFKKDAAFARPTTLNVPMKWIIKPGETKYMGIPLSDLTFVSAGNKIIYDSHSDNKMLGGELFFK